MGELSKIRATQKNIEKRLEKIEEKADYSAVQTEAKLCQIEAALCPKKTYEGPSIFPISSLSEYENLEQQIADDGDDIKNKPV